MMANHADQQLGNYLLLRMIGQGNLTTVFLGEHLRTGTKAAVKVFRTKLAGHDIEKFRDAARTLAHLEHPHILRLLDFGVEDGIPFLVMTYAPNGSLRQKFPRGMRLAPSSFVNYVRQAASALQYA